MREPTLDITLVSVSVPVTLPPPSRGRRTTDPDDPHMHLELGDGGCRVWDCARYTICGEHYAYALVPDVRLRGYGRDQLITIPFFDDVYRFLVDQYAASRRNPLGQFVGLAVTAMDAAIAERDGSRVYFARAGDRIKIGWSRKVATRVVQLQTGNAEPVRLLATTPGGRALERQMHERFADARVSGEWFAATDELLTYVASLPADVIPITRNRTA